MCSFVLDFVSSIIPLWTFLQGLIWPLNFWKYKSIGGVAIFRCHVLHILRFKNHCLQQFGRGADFGCIVTVKLYIVWIWYNKKLVVKMLLTFCVVIFNFASPPFLFFSDNPCSYGKCCAALTDLSGRCYRGHHHHHASRRLFWVRTLNPNFHYRLLPPWAWSSCDRSGLQPHAALSIVESLG